MSVHLPVDLSGFDEKGAGFFEGGAINALGTGGVDFLGGGEELGLIGIHTFGGGNFLPTLPANKETYKVDEVSGNGADVVGFG